MQFIQYLVRDLGVAFRGLSTHIDAGRSSNRQFRAKQGSALGSFAYSYRAAAHSDNLPDNGQTQAGAAKPPEFGRLAPLESIEDQISFCRRDARTAVGHFNDHLAAIHPELQAGTAAVPGGFESIG